MSDAPQQPAAVEQPEANPPPEVTFRRLGAAGPLALIASLMPIIGSIFLFARMSTIAAWLREMGTVGWAVFAALFALFTGLALLPTYALSALGGYAFGAAWGTGGAMVGCFFGSLLGYAVARRASSERLMLVINEHPKWAAVHRELFGQGDRGWWKTLGSVTLLRLPINSPFAMMNLLLAGTRVPLGPYSLGTAAGILPRTALAAWIGASVQGQLNKSTLDDASPSWLLWAGVVMWLVVVAIIGHIANKAIARLERKNAG